MSGTYRIPKYHPEVAGAFAFAVLEYFFVPTGGTFGSNTSPHEYEAFARARAIIAESLSRHEPLVMKHIDLLSKVSFEPPAPANTKFTGAVADSKYKGVLGPDNTSVKTPHNPFVDDTLIADIRRHITTAMAASVESLFILFGHDSPFRRSFLSIIKFL